MADDMNITSDYLKSILTYNPDSGKFTWVIRQETKWTDRTWNTRWAGMSAGYHNSLGYLIIPINGKKCRAHRIAWIITYGRWPTFYIDHINGDPSDNRIINLREATVFENLQNIKFPSKNKSGFLGVSWASWCRKWQSTIRFNGKSIKLGYFELAEDAHEAYLNAKRKYHTFNPCPREPKKDRKIGAVIHG